MVTLFAKDAEHDLKDITISIINLMYLCLDHVVVGKFIALSNFYFLFQNLSACNLQNITDNALIDTIRKGNLRKLKLQSCIKLTDKSM